MTDPTPASGLGAPIRRWLNENSADTRRPDGPTPRLYEVSFAQVWDALLEYVERRPRWTLLHRDEELGLITVSCTSLVFRFLDDLTIWVALDENGLTRVQAMSSARRGSADFGVNRRRLVRLLRRLDRALGPSARLLDARRADTNDLAKPTPGDGATIR